MGKDAGYLDLRGRSEFGRHSLSQGIRRHAARASTARLILAGSEVERSRIERRPCMTKLAST